MTYEKHLKQLIRQLPTALRKNIEQEISKADERASELALSAFDQAESVRDLRKNWCFATNEVTDNPGLTLAAEGLGSAILHIVNVLAEAFWISGEPIENLARHLGSRDCSIASVLLEKPDLKPPEAYRSVLLPSEMIRQEIEAWLVRAVRHKKERDAITGREARLLECLRRRGCTMTAIYTAAKVDKGDFSRWRRKQPGDDRYIPDSSTKAENIEAVLDGRRLL